MILGGDHLRGVLLFGLLLPRFLPMFVQLDPALDLASAISLLPTVSNSSTISLLSPPLTSNNFLAPPHLASSYEYTQTEAEHLRKWIVHSRLWQNTQAFYFTGIVDLRKIGVPFFQCGYLRHLAV